jgi:hypothetical protein
LTSENLHYRLPVFISPPDLGKNVNWRLRGRLPPLALRFLTMKAAV